MKTIVPCLFTAIACTAVCFGSIADVPESADGYLTTGEYANSHVTPEGYETLIIQGGGADWIEARDHSYLEVQYTSKPLSDHGGIYDIFLGHNSELLYLNGITEEITIGNNAIAILKGGRVDYITLYRRPQDSCYVTIYCQEGYQKTQSGISGLWLDGTPFSIQFINAGGPYPPTTDYVYVMPEPATLVLLGLGGLLIRRK